MLSVQNVDVAYGPTQILFNVSMEVPDKQLFCIMGRNGVGKTTLLNAIMGVLRTTGGKIEFEGRDLGRMHPYQRVKAGLAYVPQTRGSFPQLTVHESIRVVMESSDRGTKAGMDEAIDLFPRLKKLMSRKAGFLSGGEAAQLAIVRALVTKPRLLILDEPTEGIQPSIIMEIEDAILNLTGSGMAILLVEQYMEFALRLAGRYIILDAGEVVSSGVTGDLSEETMRRLLLI
ncbi:MAG: ATP-binding cassette domain-containing protein [Actinomycetota bacterium]